MPIKAGIRGIIDARSCMLKEHVIYIASLPDSIYWEILGIWDGICPNAAWKEPSLACPVECRAACG